MKTLNDSQKPAGIKKKYKNRKSPPVIIVLDEVHIDWLKKNVSNRSKYIRKLITAAMLLARPEDIFELVNRHIKTKLLEFNAIKRAAKDSPK